MDLRSMASLYEEALSAAREEGPSAVREHSVSIIPPFRTSGLFSFFFWKEYLEPLLRMIQAGTFTFWISGTGINPPDRTF